MWELENICWGVGVEKLMVGRMILLYIIADSQVLVGCLEGCLDELHVFVSPLQPLYIRKLQRRLTPTFARRLTSFYPGTASSRTGSAKEHRCFCILQKPSQMIKTCIYLEGVPRWIRAGESQAACTKGKAYQRGSLFHCLCRSMTQPLQGDAKESGAEKDSLGGSGIVLKSSSALGHRFSDWVACLWGWTKQSRRAQAGKEEAGTFALCLSFMIVFKNKLKKSKRRDEQDEPLKMVDREVDREMGLELLECLFETQVASDTKGSAGEYSHKISFFIIFQFLCVSLWLHSLENFTELHKLCCRFSFPCTLQHIAIMIIMINYVSSFCAVTGRNIHSTRRLSSYLEISWLLIRSHSVRNYYFSICIFNCNHRNCSIFQVKAKVAEEEKKADSYKELPSDPPDFAFAFVFLQGTAPQHADNGFGVWQSNTEH